jgi:hypothetical protein
MRVLRFLVLFALFLSPACARSGRKPVYPVQGRVVVHGRPAAQVQVTLHPLDDSDPTAIQPVGLADEQGRFTLTTYRQGDGAPAGDYGVTVQWFLAVPSPDRSGEYVTVNHLPARYGQVQSSGLRVTVSPGRNELPPFELSAR